MALYSYREGYQSEKLAAFLLSKFSFISQPLTTSDDSTAVDYYCTMFDIKSKTSPKGNKYDDLLPTLPFAVQVKSKWEPDMSKYVEKFDKIKVPFFIGISSKKDLLLTLYAGIGIPMIYSYIGKRMEKGEISLFASQVDTFIPSITKTFEYIESKKKAILYFIKVAEISSSFDYKESPINLKGFIEVCKRMQNNIAARHRNEFLFDDYNSKTLSFAGDDSVKVYWKNFLDRLAECFGNIAYKKNILSADINKEFDLYEKCYNEMIQIFSDGDLPYIRNLYEKAKKAKEEDRPVNQTGTYLTPDATTGFF